jgi:hypothetical protein
MIDFALLAEIILKITAQRLDQTLAKALVGGREQNRATIIAAMRPIKRQLLPATVPPGLTALVSYSKAKLKYGRSTQFRIGRYSTLVIRFELN